MKLEFNFVPAVIIYFKYINTAGVYPEEGHIKIAIWGDKLIYEHASRFIHKLLIKEDCIFAAEKGLGAYKIIPASMPAEEQ